MTMRLEALMASTNEPPLAEYRSLLRSAAESGVGVDHADVAEAFADLARRLNYSAAAVRADYEIVRRSCILEGRVDLSRLAADQAELERVSAPDHAYHRVGGELDRTLLRLQGQLDAALGADRAEILAEMEAAKERGRVLTRARRVVEDKVIAALNARDRLSAFRQSHRRLFPADAD